MISLELRDPFEAFRAWYAEAVAREADVPNAMALATARDGVPSVRVVLMKEFEPTGIVFFTNLESRKSRELAENPRASVVFHWKSLQRQVLAAGGVERVTDPEADAYFVTRPRGSQLGAWASAQSRPLASREQLDLGLSEVVFRFEEGAVPRPDFWGGFRLRPDRIEFWQGRRDRLHDRVEFTRTPDGWSRRLLYP